VPDPGAKHQFRTTARRSKTIKSCRKTSVSHHHQTRKNKKKSRRSSLLTINLELHLKGGNPQPPNQSHPGKSNQPRLNFH